MPTATTPHIAFPTNITPALLFAQSFTLKQRCTLGSVEALARKNARSDRVFLELFCFFFLLREKRKTTTICKRSYYQNFAIQTLKNKTI
jgi:hypothetical protein